MLAQWLCFSQCQSQNFPKPGKTLGNSLFLAVIFPNSDLVLIVKLQRHHRTQIRQMATLSTDIITAGKILKGVEILFSKREEGTKTLWQARKKKPHIVLNMKKTNIHQELVVHLLCFIQITVLQLWKLCYLCLPELWLLIRATTWASTWNRMCPCLRGDGLRNKGTTHYQHFKKGKLNLFITSKGIGHFGNPQ